LLALRISLSIPQVDRRIMKANQKLVAYAISFIFLVIQVVLWIEVSVVRIPHSVLTGFFVVCLVIFIATTMVAVTKA